MSLRKRACTSCVAAKRKCDLAFPTCHRCAHRSLACRYPYPPTISRGDHLCPAEPTNRNILTGVHPSDESAIASDNAQCLDAIQTLVDGFCISPTIDPTSAYGGYTPQPSWPVTFDRRILEFYPRVEDHATWQFCVTTLLAQIDVFLRHGTAFFMHPSAGDLPPPLRAAYGVCAAYKLQKVSEPESESAFPFSQQLLATEVDSLLVRRQQPPAELQAALAELCAILLYYIIVVFGRTTGAASLAARTDTLLAQRTAHVESLELATRRSAVALVEVGLVSDDEAMGLWRACDGARKVVMVSYLAREICHVLRWKTCYLLRQIVALPVSKVDVRSSAPEDSTGLLASSRWRDVVTYDQFVRDWEAGELAVADEFGSFLISACKGVGAM